jgi:hypothetical protein
MIANYIRFIAACSILLGLAACGGGGGGSAAEPTNTQPTTNTPQQPTLSLSEQKERLEGVWIETCPSAYNYGNNKFGPESTRDQVTFTGPDASGVIMMTVVTQVFESGLPCYARPENTSPVATITQSQSAKLKFNTTTRPANAPVDVYDVSFPAATAQVSTTAAATATLTNGKWNIAFKSGNVMTIDASEPALSGELPIIVTSLNGVPNANLVFSAFFSGAGFGRVGRVFWLQ